MKITKIKADYQRRLLIETAFKDTLLFRGYNAYSLWDIEHLSNHSGVPDNKLKWHRDGKKYLMSDDLLRLSTFLEMPVDYILKGIPQDVKKTDESLITVEVIKGAIKIK